MSYYLMLIIYNLTEEQKAAEEGSPAHHPTKRYIITKDNRWCGPHVDYGEP